MKDLKQPDPYNFKEFGSAFVPKHNPPLQQSTEPKNEALKPPQLKKYDETQVSFCPHCFSSTHTVIKEDTVGDFCGKCGKCKPTEPQSWEEFKKTCNFIGKEDANKIKVFIDNLLIKSKQGTLDEADNQISELLKEFSNTPLDERGNGWDWLLKLRTKLRI